MDKFGCDYACRTVGESIIKHHIPNDWCAEFDAYDGVPALSSGGLPRSHRSLAMTGCLLLPRVEVFPIPIVIKKVTAHVHGTSADQILRQLHEIGGGL